MRLALVFNPFSYKLHEENLRVVQRFFGLFPPLSLCWVAAIAMIAGSKNPEQAKPYYEFVNSKESMIILAKEHYRIPARSDIPRDSLPKWIAETEIKPMEINWEIFSEKSMEWMKYWDQNIKNRGQ